MLVMEPSTVVLTEQGALTPLGQAIRNHTDFATGWNRCYRMQPVDLCENDSQRNGWWAYLDEEAAGMYMTDAVRRGVSDERIYSTIGGW